MAAREVVAQDCWPESVGWLRGESNVWLHPHPNCPEGDGHQVGRLLHDRGVAWARTRDVLQRVVIEVHTRRVRVLGSTPHQNDALVVVTGR